MVMFVVQYFELVAVVNLNNKVKYSVCFEMRVYVYICIKTKLHENISDIYFTVRPNYSNSELNNCLELHILYFEII